MRRNEGRKEGRREGRKEGRKRTTRLFSSGRMNLIKIDEIGSLSPAAASADEAGVPERLFPTVRNPKI